MNISYFICGYVTIKANYDNITPLLNLCMYYCIPYSDFRAETDGVLLTMRLSAKNKLEREAKARGIEFETVKKGGIPTLLSRYKHRYGIAMGMLIAAALIFFSHRFVWPPGRISTSRRSAPSSSEASASTPGPSTATTSTDPISWMVSPVSRVTTPTL